MSHNIIGDINVSKNKIELFEENEKFNSYVGDILSKYRRINRISQEKLGGLIGVGRKTISDIENMGFVASEMANKPATMLPLAFKGAFLKNHKFVKQDIIDEIFSHISDKQGLIAQLSEMIVECYQSLMGDEVEKDTEGNVSWEIV